MPELRHSHLDQRDPAMQDARNIKDEADREIDAYDDDHDLVLLLPEDRWEEFLHLTKAQADGDEARYRGVLFHKAAVTAVVAQEGF